MIIELIDKPMTDYKITTEKVYAGYDLIISNINEQVTLLIHDITQAEMIAQRIIAIATEQKITLYAAMIIFNQGMGMFETGENTDN